MKVLHSEIVKETTTNVNPLGRPHSPGSSFSSIEALKHRIWKCRTTRFCIKQKNINLRLTYRRLGLNNKGILHKTKQQIYRTVKSSKESEGILWKHVHIHKGGDKFLLT